MTNITPLPQQVAGSYLEPPIMSTYAKKIGKDKGITKKIVVGNTDYRYSKGIIYQL